MKEIKTMNYRNHQGGIMKIKTIIGATLLLAFSLFAVGLFSQTGRGQTRADNSTNTPAMSSYMGQRGMMGEGMMNGWMMNGSMMGRNMMENYGTTQKMFDRLASDLSAARVQSGSAALKSKLADARSVVAQLKGELSQYWGMMQNMPMYANHCYGTESQQDQK